MADSSLFDKKPMPRWVTAAVVCCLLLLGAMIFRDYGTPWDESYQRNYGIAAYTYVMEGNAGLLTNTERYHGPALEFVLTALEKAGGIRTVRNAIFLRHAGLFVLFAFSCLSFLALARRMTRSNTVGLLTLGFLLLSPRIFAESFYNTKDIAFLAVFVFAMHTLVLLLERPSMERVLLHAAVSAFLICIRTAGALGVAISLALLAHEAFVRRPLRAYLVTTAIAYAAAVCLLVPFFWPSLWHDPLGEFAAATKEALKFPWGMGVFYGGRYIPAPELPWHYIPVWLAITTPPLYMVFGAVGFVVAVVRLWNRRMSPDGRMGRITLLWFAIPFVGLWICDPVLYDGWRHFYFIYPALLLLAGLGVQWSLVAIRHLGRTGLWIFCLGITLAMAQTTGWMIAAHPHEYVYFSPAIGGIRGAQGSFELDYWGLSYKQGLEKLLAFDRRPLISIAFDNQPGDENLAILTEADRSRIRVVAKAEAEYFLSNHRWGYQTKPENPVPITISVDGVDILSVERLR